MGNHGQSVESDIWGSWHVVFMVFMVFMARGPRVLWVSTLFDTKVTSIYIMRIVVVRSIEALIQRGLRITFEESQVVLPLAFRGTFIHTGLTVRLISP